MTKRKQKSCYECRTRHLKCDAEEPCQHCSRSGRRCNFEEEHIFVSEFNGSVVRRRKRYDLTFQNQKWVDVPIVAFAEGQEGDSGDGNDSEDVRTRKKRQSASNLNAFFDYQQSRFFTEIQSPGLERSRLQSEYRNLYPGQDKACAPGVDHVLKYAPIHPIMTVAVDAASLLFVGNKHKDTRLTHAALDSYTQTVTKLRREVGNLTLPPTILLTIVHLLQTCELFGTISADPSSWLKHGLGNLYIISRCNNANIFTPVHTQLAAPIASEIRIQYTLWAGLLTRKRTTAHERFYCRVNHKCASLLPAAFTVPRILERADAVCSEESSPASVAHVADCLDAVSTAEQKLTVRLATGCPNRAFPPFEVVPLDENGDMTCEPVAFPSVYSFTDLACASVHVLYWTCVLELRRTRVILLKRRSFLLSQGFGDDEDDDDNNMDDDETVTSALRATDACADHISRALPFLIRPENGYMGLMNSLPALQFAAQWYAENYDGRKLDWCRRIGRALRDAGLNPSPR